MVYRITAVCTGNICRSPIAEAVVRAELSTAGITDVVVDSAGTSDWHVGEGADPRAIAALNRVGLNLEHTVRQFDPTWMSEGHTLAPDLVLALDHSHLLTLRNRTPTAVHGRIRLLRTYDPRLASLADADLELEVPDPYYGSSVDFDDVLRMITDAARGLAQQWVSGSVLRLD